MPASDLFRDIHDADFRLKGTYLVIGKEVFYVNKVREGETYRIEAEFANLLMTNSEDEVFSVKLGQLPLSAMTYCPSGWNEGSWYCRGPARHRYQGIMGSSLWSVHGNGYVDTGGVGSQAKYVLNALAKQPRQRRVGKKDSGILTRDVYIHMDGSLYIRGLIAGDYFGDDLVKLREEPDQTTLKLLENARLKMV